MAPPIWSTQTMPRAPARSAGKHTRRYRKLPGGGRVDDHTEVDPVLAAAVSAAQLVVARALCARQPVLVVIDRLDHRPVPVYERRGIYVPFADAAFAYHDVDPHGVVGQVAIERARKPDH